VNQLKKVLATSKTTKLKIKTFRRIKRLIFGTAVATVVKRMDFFVEKENYYDYIEYEAFRYKRQALIRKYEIFADTK